MSIIEDNFVGSCCGRRRDSCWTTVSWTAGGTGRTRSRICSDVWAAGSQPTKTRTTRPGECKCFFLDLISGKKNDSNASRSDRLKTLSFFTRPPHTILVDHFKHWKTTVELGLENYGRNDNCAVTMLNYFGNEHRVPRRRVSCKDGNGVCSFNFQTNKHGCSDGSWPGRTKIF